MKTATSERTETRVCQQHGEYTARLIVFFDRELGGACPTCAREREAQDKARQAVIAANDERRRVESLFQRAGIPPRFQNRTFDNFMAKTDGQAAALRRARAYVEQWPDVLAKGTCLIFAGNPGTGKTHLACAIANALIPQGISALFTTVSDAMRAIKRSYDASSTITEAEAIASFVGPKLLILDEVGASRGTEHEMQLLFDIFNKRYEHARPSLVLTNLDATTLREFLGERITDRLREGGGKLISFTWESHRA